MSANTPTNVLMNPMVKEYKKVAIEMLNLYFPQLTYAEIERVVDGRIKEDIRDHTAVVDNSYKKMQVNTTLLELADYIMSKQPIITAYGVMFMQHGAVPNPIYNMIDSFIQGRAKVKKEMFKYPKGSAEFTKLNLIQLLHKLDANAYYGASGMYSSIYYNLYAAASVTAQGRSAISTAALLFESILANNVPFGSLDELIDFIYNVKNDPRTIDDRMVINHFPTMQETFYKLISSCGFAWIPTENEMMIVWRLLAQLDQGTLTRLYYKNNLYELVSNDRIIGLVITMLQKLDNVFIDPNHIPDEIAPEMEYFKKILFEYLYYPHQIIDRLDKMDALIRDVSIIQDTDSSIVSLDAWYNFVLGYTRGVDMKIKQYEYDMVDEKLNTPSYVEEYDFFDDAIIEIQRYNNPIKMIPQDNLRYSIIAILGNAIYDMVNDYMYRYCSDLNSHLPEGANIPKGGRCMLVMKNEFLFRTLLLTMAKKHYASLQELQEGNVVPVDESLDVKGMEAFAKSTIAEETRNKLKKVLYEDILNTPAVDQVKVIKSIAAVEKQIYDSIQHGEKTFYKPAKVKSASAYGDPMRIQGIKASMAYNALHETGTEAIDLTIRNSVDIVKVEITKKNVGLIEESHPEVYRKAVELMNTNKYYAGGIDSIAIPMNEPVPDWILPFIRYAEIINDNVSKFPLESIGLYRGNPHNNSTNIVAF